MVEDLDSGKIIRMNIIVELNRCGANYEYIVELDFFLCKIKSGYVEAWLD